MKFGVMKAHRRNRLLLIALLVVAAGLAVTFTLSALRQNVNLFYAPQQIVSGEAPVGALIMAGGMVVEDSVQRAPEGLTVVFAISDLQSAEVQVEYDGILPDLFREGQGIVAEGRLRADGVLVAERVLAKHDENYMPPEVARALDKAHEKPGT